MTLFFGECCILCIFRGSNSSSHYWKPEFHLNYYCYTGHYDAAAGGPFLGLYIIDVIVMIAFRTRLLRQLVGLVHAINTKKKRWGQKCNAVRKPWPESSNWNALLISLKGKSSVMNSSTRISCTHVFYMYQQPMHHLTFKVTLWGVP